MGNMALTAAIEAQVRNIAVTASRKSLPLLLYSTVPRAKLGLGRTRRQFRLSFLLLAGLYCRWSRTSNLVKLCPQEPLYPLKIQWVIFTHVRSPKVSG